MAEDSKPEHVPLRDYNILDQDLQRSPIRQLARGRRFQGDMTDLEMWRSGRRLSDGASKEFRKSLEKAALDERTLPKWDRTVRNCRSSQTFISCLIDDMQWALGNLNAPINLIHLEEMAVFVHESHFLMPCYVILDPSWEIGLSSVFGEKRG